MAYSFSCVTNTVGSRGYPSFYVLATAVRSTWQAQVLCEGIAVVNKWTPSSSVADYPAMQFIMNSKARAAVQCMAHKETLQLFCIH
jgi:hypothetical protein